MLCDTQCGAVNCLSYDVILTGQDMDYIKDLFQLYNDNGMLMLLYVIGWLLIVVLERKKVNKVVFAYSAWYLPLVILNPLVGMVLQRLDILPYRMVRIYWLLPVLWPDNFGDAIAKCEKMDGNTGGIASRCSPCFCGKTNCDG